jgi:hypothetical protein
MYEIAEAIEYVGPSSGAQTPAETAMYAGFDTGRDPESQGRWFEELQLTVASATDMPPLEPAILIGVALGLAAGAIIGRKEAGEMQASIDDVDVLEGTDWVPHND